MNGFLHSSEGIFKILFIIVFFPFIMIWIRSFVLSGFKKNSFYTTTEGVFSAFLFRILQTISLIGILLYLISSNQLMWAYVSLPAWIRYTGFFIGLLSTYSVFLTMRTLGSNFFASLNLKEDHQIITKGLYKWIRHPLYILFAFIWIGLCLISSNLLVGIPGILSYIVIYFGRVPREEKMMIEHFGQEYYDYMSKTGSIFPRLSSKK